MQAARGGINFKIILFILRKLPKSTELNVILMPTTKKEPNYTISVSLVNKVHRNIDMQNSQIQYWKMRENKNT